VTDRALGEPDSLGGVDDDQGLGRPEQQIDIRPPRCRLLPGRAAQEIDVLRRCADQLSGQRPSSGGAQPVRGGRTQQRM